MKLESLYPALFKAVEHIVARGPDQQRLKRALRRAEKVAEEHTRKYGTPCKARLIRARNGEAAIVYDVTHLNGEPYTLHNLNDAAFKTAQH